MKKILFTFMVCTFLFPCAYSQTEWFPVGAEWYYDWGDTNWGSYVRWHYFVEKDTVVDGQACRMIRSESKERITYAENGGLKHYWVNGEPDGDEIVYEENGRVYYYFDGKFRKIFDFSVNVGDSVDFELRNFTAFSDGKTDTTITIISCRIEEITSIAVSGTELREIRASYIEYIERPYDWITIPKEYVYLEKAGSEFPGKELRHGLFPNFSNGAVFPELYYRLICYHDTDVEYITDWWQKQGEPCEVAVSNVLISNPKKAIQIYPNPVKDRLTISGKSGNDSEMTIILYDAAGKIVFEKKEYLPCTLNAGHLLSGIYYIRIFDGTECLTSKKIIKL